MSGVTNDIEPTLFRGNIALHTGTNPASDGDGSLEIQGTVYCDKIASYNSDTPIAIFDTLITPNNLSCNTISSATLALSSPLSVSSGGIGTASLPTGRILIGNGQSGIASSSALLYNSATATLTCTNQAISGNLTLQTALSVLSGGTGNVTFTTGNVLYGNGSAALAHSDGFNWNNTTGTLSVTNVSVTSSGTFAGSLSAGVATVTSLNVTADGTFAEAVTVGTATAANHAATKGYVDSLVINAGVVSAGTGLTKTASVLSVNTTQPQIVSVGTLTSLGVSGTFTSTSTTQLSNTSNVITGSQGACNLFGDLQLANGASNCIYFRDIGLNVPTFTNRSLGTKLVICPKLSASSVDYAIGYESSNLWFSTTTTATGFKWYGGTNAAMTLSGTGVLTPSGSLCLPSALTSTRRNNTSTAWYNLGLMDATATADGTRVILRMNGSSGYTGNTSSGGETVINVSINNNTNASAANLNGTFYSFGDTPSVTAVKFVQNGGNRYSYYVYASMAAYPSMSIRAVGPTGFIWTETFTSTTDPGADSATVKEATSMFSVNSPASFLTTVRASQFLTGWGWMQGNGYGIALVGGAISDSFLSLKSSSVASSSPELFITSDSTVLKRNDGTTNSLYINNATGVITVDYALNISATGTIQGVTPGEFAQLANINSTSISNTQWAYLGALNQNVHSTSSPTFAALATGALSASTGTFSGTVSGTSFTGNLIGGTVSGSTGTFTGALSGTSFTGNLIGGTLTATTGTFSSTVTGSSFSGNLIGGTVSGTTGTFTGAVTGTSFGGNLIGGTLSATTGTFSGITNVSNTTKLSTTGNTINSTSGSLTVAGDLHLYHPTNPQLVFLGGTTVAPAFTTRSGGTRLIIYPGVTANTVDYAIGMESSNMWFSTNSTSTGFKWYGGTSPAATLSGAGVLTLTSGLSAATGTFTGAISGTSFSGNLIGGTVSGTTGTFTGAVGAPSFSGNLVGGSLIATTGVFSSDLSTDTNLIVNGLTDSTALGNGAVVVLGGMSVAKRLRTNGGLVVAGGAFVNSGGVNVTGVSTFANTTTFYGIVCNNSLTVSGGMSCTTAGFSGAVAGPSFSGNLIGGTLNATTGTFSGAVTGTSFTGNVIGGTVSGTTGTFSGAVSGTSFTGNLTGGTVSGTTGTFSGTVTAKTVFVNAPNDYDGTIVTFASKAEPSVYNLKLVEENISEFTWYTTNGISFPTLKLATGNVTFMTTTDATSTTSGPVKFQGGVGISKSLYIGGALSGTTGAFSGALSGTSFTGNVIGGTVSGTTGTFTGAVASSSFLTGPGSMVGSGSGLFVLGGSSATNYISIKSNSVTASSPELIMTSATTILRRNGGILNSLYIDNNSGVITVDNALNISSGATIQNVTVTEFAQLANINAVTISNTQWAYLGALNQDVASTSTPTFQTALLGSTSANVASATRRDYVDGLSYLTSGTGLTKTGSTLSVNAAQPGITSVGTLSSLVVSGTLSSGAFSATTGTFSGAVTGTSFTGNLIGGTVSGTTGTFTGAVSGPSFAGNIVGGTVSGTTGTFSGAVSGTSFTGNLIGGTISGTTGTFSGAVSGTSFTGNLIGGTISGTTGTFSGAVSGTSFTGNLIGGTLSATTGAFSGITNVSNTTKLSTTGNTIGGTSGALTIAGDLHLYNATNPQIVFSTGTQAAPSFTTRSSGTRLIVYPNVSASSVDFALGVEASSFWFSTSQSTTSFKWYGGTTLAASLTGAGVLSLASGLNAPTATFTGAVSGTSFTGNHIGGTFSGTTGSFSSLTESTSVTTGAIVTAGGIGVAKNAYVGQTLYSTNGSFGYLISGSLNCNTLLFYSGSGNSLTIQPGIIPASYTLTFPTAPPPSDGCITLTDTDGTSYFQPPVLASVFSTTSSLNKCKIWSTTASVTSGGAVTVFPTSDNLSTGTALFSTILFASATATVNTTTMSSVALTGLRSISVDRRTVIFNVTNPSGTAATIGTSVMVMIIGT